MKSTRRGSDPPVHRPEKTPRFQIQLDKWPLSPGTPREASGVPCLNPRRGLTLLSPVCRDPAIGVRNRRYPAVPASTGDEALFQCTKPSGVPRGPSHLQFPWLLRATSSYFYSRFIIFSWVVLTVGEVEVRIMAKILSGYKYIPQFTSVTQS